MTTPVTTSGIRQKTEYNGRIHEVLKQIKGKDKRISSREEAEAILEFAKHAKVIWSDNKDSLPLACREARSYLQYGNKNLGDYVLDAYNNLKEIGTTILARLSNAAPKQLTSL